ncbi:MAG: helix-turn-helix domain-containing protein [Nitrososphaeria archaeon]
MIETIWIRGYHEIDFNRPNTYFVMGVRGAGKSSLLEALALEHMERGAAVFDLFGSRDGENLAWLRSPYTSKKRVLLLHGDGVKLNTKWETKPTSQLKLQDLEDYDIIISSSPLYVSPSQEFAEIGRLINSIYNRLSWKRMVYLLVREAANLVYSRLALNEDQTTAKTEIIYLLREARHMGVALGLDTLRFMSIDIDLRNNVDFLMLKAVGVLGLPDDLQWLYSFMDPHKLATMPKQFFGVVTKEGDIGFGRFNAIPWHKQEGEDILHQVDIEIVAKDETAIRPKQKFELSDEEIAKILELHQQGYSLTRISAILGRSRATVDRILLKYASPASAKTATPEKSQ